MNARNQIDAILDQRSGMAPCCPFGTYPDEWKEYAAALALVYVGYGESPETAAESAAGAVVNAGDVEAYALLDIMEAELAPEDMPPPPADWPESWREQARRYAYGE